MTQVVQAKCPFCKNMLRIPATWLNMPMKCKHCRQIFQTGAPNEESKATRQTGAGLAAKTPLPANGSPLIRYSSAANPYRPRKRGFWKGAFALLLVLAIVGGAGYFIHPYIGALFNAKANNKEDNLKVAATKNSPPAHVIEKKNNKIPEFVPEKKASPPAKIEPVIEPNEGQKSDDPPKKVDPPQKKDPPKKKDADIAKKKKASPEDNAPYPRRALLINVSNYLLFNPLSYGNDRTGKFPGSNTGVLADTMTRPPFNIPATQVTELSDAGKKAFATAKEVIEHALTDYLDSARGQDRVTVLFTGHALSIEKEAYLVPVEGNRDDAKTLIPLKWVYDKLAKCPARQKLLILDVFRFPPARGEELPGTGEMTEEFDTLLLNPPKGLQVWSACIKGQQSIELESGSLFLQALSNALQEGPHPITSPKDPLPLDRLVAKVNDRLKKTLAAQKIEQVSRLSGTHGEEDGAPFNPAEPFPPKLVLKAVTPGGAAANSALVQEIINELNRLPPVRSSQKPVKKESLPLFSAKALEDYQPDYKSWPELLERAKNKEKYPLRAGVLEAINILRDSEKIRMEEVIHSPITPQKKAKFFDEQKAPGIMIFEMEGALTQLKAAATKGDKETSKRWLAHFDYTLARLQSRLVYLYEYNNILAQVRGDNLPELGPDQTLWRVGSIKKVQISEPKVKDMVKNIQKAWKRITDENPGTPWAILAARENMTALGLVWRASRD